eukprot:gene7134-14514_t
MNKPGGVGVSVDLILRASAMASHRATAVHAQLATALVQLEEDVKTEREERLRRIQTLRMKGGNIGGDVDGVDVVSMGMEDVIEEGDDVAIGIDRNDPMLAWATLHKAAVFACFQSKCVDVSLHARGVALCWMLGIALLRLWCSFILLILFGWFWWGQLGCAFTWLVSGSCGLGKVRFMLRVGVVYLKVGVSGVALRSGVVVL